MGCGCVRRRLRAARVRADTYRRDGAGSGTTDVHSTVRIDPPASARRRPPRNSTISSCCGSSPNSAAQAPSAATDRLRAAGMRREAGAAHPRDAASRGRSRSACTSASRNRSTSGTPGNPTAIALRTALWAPSAPITQPASTSLPLSSRTVTPSALASSLLTRWPHSIVPPSSASRLRNAASISACEMIRPVRPPSRSMANPICSPASSRPSTVITTLLIGSARSGRSPSAPSRSSTSTPRGCRPSAREVTAGPAAASSTLTAMPASRNPHASVRPVGPAPTTTTWGTPLASWGPTRLRGTISTSTLRSLLVN